MQNKKTKTHTHTIRMANKNGNHIEFGYGQKIFQFVKNNK